MSLLADVKPSAADSALPLLYSFRRCPYAIRARLALQLAGIAYRLQEVSLKDKPAELLALSPKATVPVMRLADGTVMEQSLDIMCWALRQDTSRNWLLPDASLPPEAASLIAENDGSFKKALDHFKYPQRYPAIDPQLARAEVSRFFAELERRLQLQPWLSGAQIGIADLALVSFIRQAAAVDTDWFAGLPYISLQRWLQQLLESADFQAVMQKAP